MKTSLFISCVLLVFFSCKKKDTNSDDSPATNCVATKSSVENISIFPADNPWNQDISSAPVHPYNTQIIAAISGNSIKADFGSGTWNGAPIGIPFTVVCRNQQKVPITFRANNYDGNYGSESDPGPYAIPLNAPVEGAGNGDAHVIAVDQETGMLYELYNASVVNSQWQASSGAIFNLKSNMLRPEGWTSADAAGLPIFPGLVRYDEIVKGVIDHPIRFTLSSNNVKPAYIHPARHKVNSTGGQYSLPFGARIRLRQSFDISSFSPTNRIILTAMKKYGLILADIGSNLYISGAPDERWNNDDLQQLRQIKGADFEVVQFN